MSMYSDYVGVQNSCWDCKFVVWEIIGHKNNFIVVVNTEQNTLGSQFCWTDLDADYFIYTPVQNKTETCYCHFSYFWTFLKLKQLIESLLQPTECKQSYYRSTLNKEGMQRVKLCAAWMHTIKLTPKFVLDKINTEHSQSCLFPQLREGNCTLLHLFLQLFSRHTILSPASN